MQQSIYVSEDLMIPSGNQRWLAALAYNSARIDELISTKAIDPKQSVTRTWSIAVDA